MGKEYINLLIRQFMAAKGYRNIDFSSQMFLDEFTSWVSERKEDGEVYLSFVNNFSCLPAIKPYNTVEVGKGKFDSIAMHNGILLFTPYTEGLDRRQIYMPFDFRVADGRVYAFDKGTGNLKDLKENELGRFMTQNPYTPNLLNGWEDLNNSGQGNITVGIYGNVHDRDFDDKYRMIKEFKERIDDETVICDKATVCDSYYFAISTNRKKLERKLTRN